MKRKGIWDFFSPFASLSSFFFFCALLSIYCKQVFSSFACFHHSRLNSQTYYEARFIFSSWTIVSESVFGFDNEDHRKPAITGSISSARSFLVMPSLALVLMFGLGLKDEIEWERWKLSTTNNSGRPKTRRVKRKRQTRPPVWYLSGLGCFNVWERGEHHRIRMNILLWLLLRDKSQVSRYLLFVYTFLHNKSECE